MSSRARAALAYVALFAAVGAHAPYLVLYYRSLGLDLAATGGVISVASVVALATAPAWGSLSDRLRGSPAVFLAATATALAGTILLAQAHDVLVVAVAAAVTAGGLAGMSPILDARALEASGSGRAGYGPLRAWGSASYIASSFGTGAAIQAFGIHALFAVLGGAIVATGAVGLTLRPAQVQAAGLAPGAARRLFGRHGVGLFLAAAFVTWTALAAVMGFYALRLQEAGAPASVVGMAAALGAAVEVPIMLRFPRLVARFGPERLLVVGAAVFAARALVAGVASDPLVLVLASGVGGVGYALFLVGGVTYVSLHAPPQLAATAQGAFQGVSVGLGQVSAAAIGGVVGAAVGLARLYLLSAAVGVVATWLVAVSVGVGRPRRRPRFLLQPDE